MVTSVLPKTVATIAVVVALGTALGNTEIGTEVIEGAAAVVTQTQPVTPPDLPGFIYEWLSWVVVGLVTLVWWSVRKLLDDHKKEIASIRKDLERHKERADAQFSGLREMFIEKETRDVERVRDILTQLQLTVAELKAVCPYCTSGGGD